MSIAATSCLLLMARSGAIWRVPGGESLQPQHYLAAARELADFPVGRSSLSAHRRRPCAGMFEV